MPSKYNVKYSNMADMWTKHVGGESCCHDDISDLINVLLISVQMTATH